MYKYFITYLEVYKDYIKNINWYIFNILIIV